MPQLPLSPDLIERLKKLGSATIHEAQGQAGALSPAIKPIHHSMSVVGRALTVDARPGDNLVIHYALSKVAKGDVVVVDAKGFSEAGAWGDILALAAQKAGVSGLVIDGAVRDAEAMISMGFPVFSKGLSIQGTNKNQPGTVNVSIVCGGVHIAPGDVIVGDCDGVVAIPFSKLDEVLAASEKRAQTEEHYRNELNQGKTTIELLNLRGVLNKFGML